MTYKKISVDAIEEVKEVKNIIWKSALEDEKTELQKRIAEIDEMLALFNE